MLHAHGDLGDAAHLIENHPLHVPDDVCSLVQHGPQDLSCADQAWGRGLDLDIASEQSHL